VRGAARCLPEASTGRNMAHVRAGAMAFVSVLLTACIHGQRTSDASPFAVALPTSARGPGEPPGWEVPAVARESERNRCIDRALADRDLNDFGEPRSAAHPDDRPLAVRKGIDRYQYVMRHRPDIAIECSRAPGEPER
jgi:hypothetical protein